MSNGRGVPKTGAQSYRLQERKTLLKRVERRAGTQHLLGSVERRSRAYTTEMLLPIARALVEHHANGSTSWLQRLMRISFSEAERLMFRLERMGVVSASDALGAGAVLQAAE